MRGYFEIGILSPKFEENYGTLARSAYQLGASGVFTIGAKYRNNGNDTTKSHRHLPIRNYTDWDDFMAHKPMVGRLIAIEDPKYQGRYLQNYCHPEQALYVLGNEGSGIPEDLISDFDDVVSIESDRTYSYNVAMAGTIVMYDRFIKRK